MKKKLSTKNSKEPLKLKKFVKFVKNFDPYSLETKKSDLKVLKEFDLDIYLDDPFILTNKLLVILDQMSHEQQI